MNILIPHTWLLEHLETKATPEEIQKYLSLSGPSVERIYEKEGEPVYDIEVTTNRVDCMSVRGIAREAAVILPQFGVKASLKPLKLPQVNFEHSNEDLPLPKIVNDPDVCKRILCVILRNVRRAVTPEWMAKRLRQIDGNVHDSVIDITNYVTHELGHPCHAFDYDQIMKLGGEIIVKVAAKGKKFTTLDGVEYTTVGGEVVFENPVGEIIDLPAIKGTANSSINPQTKNILFWLESIEPTKVRFASMTHAIRTVAAQLNEKDVDPNLADDVLAESVKLYEELCQAKVASPIFDDFPDTRELKPISVKLSYIANYLGLTLPTDRIVKILTDLECQATIEGEEVVVKPPTFRPDLTIPSDIVEEIARIYGYHNLPSVLMTGPIPTHPPTDLDLPLESKIKHFLADTGWQEVYSYSLVSEAIAKESGLALEKHLKLQNPLTDDRIDLRRALAPSLEEVLNNNPQYPQATVFEIANVYHPRKNDIPLHELRLGWVSKLEYRQVRGNLEALAHRLFMPELNFEPITENAVDYRSAAAIHADSETGENMLLGYIGVLPSGLIGGEWIMDNVRKAAGSHPLVKPIPKTMPIIEDLTFTLPPKTEIGPVLAAISEVSSLIQKVGLKDVYKQNYTLTISYQDAEVNLEAKTIEPIRKQIVATVKSKFAADLVGNLQ